jgi:F0F1-type ATP synthase membrane subunit b/b'
MEIKNYLNAGIFGLGHLLGSDFDWLGTGVIILVWLVGSFIVDKISKMYSDRKN